MSTWKSRAASQVLRRVGAMPLPTPANFSPTFVVGCGRSGTTVTVKTLGLHPDICSLNEPRYIWRAIDPATDVWDRESQTGGGRFDFSASDATERARGVARRSFYGRLLVSRRRFLVEKLPINTFRLNWIDALFPTARYINVRRHPLSVAASIADRGLSWFGHDDWRWRQLQRLAGEAGFPAKMLEAGDDLFRRGLLEWTLSTERAEAFFEGFDSQRVVHFRYEDLLADPPAQFSRMVELIGASGKSDVINIMANEVGQPTNAPPENAAALLSERTLALLARFGYSPESLAVTV